MRSGILQQYTRALRLLRTPAAVIPLHRHRPSHAPAPNPLHRRELLAIFSTATVLSSAYAAMGGELKEAKIIPDLLDKVAAQPVDLQVSFGDTAVKDGVLIPPNKAAHAPRLQINGDASAAYTLITSDPDPPDPANPTRKEWLHWLVTNIRNNDVTSGTELASYMGPAPPIGTHRYVFMLFKQPGDIKAEDPTHDKRAHFNTRDFAKKYRLGDPISVVWFNSHK